MQPEGLAVAPVATRLFYFPVLSRSVALPRAHLSFLTCATASPVGGGRGGRRKAVTVETKTAGLAISVCLFVLRFVLELSLLLLHLYTGVKGQSDPWLTLDACGINVDVNIKKGAPSHLVPFYRPASLCGRLRAAFLIKLARKCCRAVVPERRAVRTAQRGPGPGSGSVGNLHPRSGRG